jgi:predicted phage terminase large subunit-like protein
MNWPIERKGVVEALLRSDFPSFLRKTFGELSPGDSFRFGWHLNAIGFQLERISHGHSRRLIVTMPPRHLKSITISVAWVAWQLGQTPEKRFICLSYNNELAAKLARDCRQVMQSDWYKEVFPGTVLSRATETELETTLGGGRFATSVGGTLTGRGADVIIIDDPIKADDAMSEAIRKQAIEWTTSTLFSRLNDKRTGAIILVMQRLHENDLAGHFLGQGGWEHLNLPAIAEEEQVLQLGDGGVHHRKPDDVLHPEREPLETLMQIKSELGSHVFSAQYQQAPVPADGTLVKSAWLQRYDTEPKQVAGDQIVQSWDTASKDGVLNDFSVCITVRIRKDVIYVLNVHRQKLEFPELLRHVQLQAERFSPDVLLVEDAASGQQLIQTLEHSPIHGVPPPIACKPEGDKITRMSAGCAMIEAGRLVVPHEAPWLAEFEREILAFPGGKHDDQADALSQLLAWIRNRPKIRPIMPWISEEDSYWMY